MIRGTVRVTWGWAMTSAFVSHLSRSFPFYVLQTTKNIKTWGSLVTQAESRRDGSSRDDIQTVLPWLVSSRLSDILMRWDLAVSQCKCHSLSFSLPHPILSRPPSFFVPFSLRVASATLPEHILVLRFPLIAIPQFVWIRKIQYGIMQNIIKMDDNEKWKYVWLLFEWNRMMYVEIEYICI